MHLHLEKYHSSVTNLPGKKIYIADTLSRAYLPHAHFNQTNDFRELETLNQAQHIRMSETTFQQLKTATLKHQTPQTLMDTVPTNWL